MDLKLKGKRVLVTGSSQGIGLGIAQGFSREGAQVWLTGRNIKTLRGAAHEVDGAKSFAGDLTKSAMIKRLAGKIQATWRGLDVLVLNLGSGRSLPGLQANAVEWRRVLDLNLISAVETLRVFHPLLKHGDCPSVVAIGSIAGTEALGAPWAYGAAKAGLEHWVKSAAKDLAPEGIRVNLVAPGNIFFEGGTWDKKERKNPRGVHEMLRREVPLGRFGMVEEIADATVFLASYRSGFTTGATWVVDGGQCRS